MKLTKIRWAGFTWNFFTGCTEISPGCDHCYARSIAETPKFAGGFPNGFAPTFKPHKLREPFKVKEPQFCFVNSMSDFCHKDFTDEQRDAGMETMLEVDRHIYLILTKRAQALVRYVKGWLKRKGLDRVPSHIWFGVSIESDTYRYRADFLREVPGVRFISAEPLIEAATNLNLDGIHWLIVGGESGNGSGDFRPMPHDWARELREKAEASRVSNPLTGAEQPTAFFFKQSSGVRTETGTELDGQRFEEYPFYPSGLTREAYERQMAELHERALERKRARALKRSRSLPVINEAQGAQQMKLSPAQQKVVDALRAHYTWKSRLGVEQTFILRKFVASKESLGRVLVTRTTINVLVSKGVLEKVPGSFWKLTGAWSQ